jgi:cytoskeleton protein RodZ
MGTLDVVQQEQLRAIGTYLNQVRQEQARSLEEIAAKTYIPLRLLKAIELGQEQPLPEPVFVQGFIRRYADSLGLDGMELAQKFPVQATPLPTVTSPSAEARSREARSRAVAEPSYVSSTEDQVSRPVQSQRSTAAYLPYLAAAALLALGGIGLAVVRSISSRSPSQPDSALVLPKQPSPSMPAAPSVSPSFISPSIVASPSISPAVPSTASPRSPSPSSLSSPSPGPSAATNAPVSVEMQLTDRAWVQVTVDGVVKAEAVLPKGTRQSWSGRQQITVVSGNAGAVSVAANGGTAKIMGAPGAVTELTVKPK